MKRLAKNFRKGLVAVGLAGFLSVSPAVAGVPGGNSNVNVNITSETVTETVVTEVQNDVILESLWKIVGEAWRETKKGHIPPPKHWSFEVTVSDSDFATALADMKTELYDLAVIPGLRTQYKVVEDEMTEQQLEFVSQTYEETLTGSETETTTTVDDNGAEYGVDYIGDPNDYSTWIALGSGDVNVDVNQVTTTTEYIDALTTTQYNQVAVWSVTGVQTITPLLLDLDGDGAIDASNGQWKPHKTLDRERLAFFDFHGDKFPVLMEWPGPNDGILCEPNADGSIDGTNLFGTSTGFANGYEALRVKDADGDGKISGDELVGLAVWTDHNSDARPQNGEVQSLSEHNITELSVRHKDFVSTYVRDGRSQKMYDWWPQTFELNRVKLIPKRS